MIPDSTLGVSSGGDVLLVRGVQIILSLLCAVFDRL